ncbi:DNA repair protein RecN [Aestuariivirga litoralis]|uniref:DNA repair protein RecN n=1 Tax=Aestuariivirga litoralis TaxID=2650924 RepID=UPI0018C76873|nr:DNA repair protein RecN [Aestuariivirga litoralis]MBG1231208.1 DNA repair protein RecN [Aestuariivirga litoralis]
MLNALSIRDIVLIEKLDLALENGLTILTGETGAGKSILLDSLGLALGARGDSSLVRAGQAKGSVAASFSLPKAHAALQLLAAHEVDAEGEIVIRRIQNADGPSRATINDQPVSLNLLRQVAALLVELHGQHADRALVDVAEHRRLLDAFGGLDEQAEKLGAVWKTLSAASESLNHHKGLMAKAEAEREYLEHAAAELSALSPEANEEALLAEKRQVMMQSEQYASALDDAETALSGEMNADARLNAALRKLERRKEGAGGRLDAVCTALERVLLEQNEAHRALDEARRRFEFDPKELEQSEERLFALRAAARKYKCTVDQLAEKRAGFEAELTSITDGGATLKKLEAAYAEAKAVYEKAADALSAARRKAAKGLDKAVLAELPALKLDKARFETQVLSDASKPGADGIDRVEFVVAANPGTPLQPLMKVASGGELARFMLALKVILAAKGSAPVLIFDEIDTGVGGAVADAIGQRLSRLAGGLQVLAVTHSPQVAANAAQHLLISKMEDVGGKRMVTRVQPLSSSSRREELARMLSGASVTDAARAQAEELLAGRG